MVALDVSRERRFNPALAAYRLNGVISTSRNIAISTAIDESVVFPYCRRNRINKRKQMKLIK